MGGTCRLRGGNVIRSPFYVTEGAKSERLASEKGIPKTICWVVLFHVSWDGPGTRLYNLNTFNV